MLSIDPILLGFVILSFVALMFGMVLRYFKQPSVVAYVLTGIFLGAGGIGLIEDQEVIGLLGNIGVVLLLFFVGMEISLTKLLANWRVAILGTVAQITISVLAILGLGLFLDWPFEMIVLLGFVISLSSTTVLIKYLENRNIINTKIGMDVISILIAQDLAVIPMLIAISSMRATPQFSELLLQGIGTMLVAIFVVWIVKKKEIRLPFSEKIKEDHELQLLAAFVFCFGFAIITGLFQLSTALGAFLAGIFISSARETTWVHESLHSYKILFIAFFFVSIGMLIDIQFVAKNLGVIMLVVLVVFLTNTFLNALIFVWLKQTWRYSLFVGSMLAPIGEFSFLLVAVGLQNDVIDEYTYQLTVAVIAITLLLSPLWISLFSRLVENMPKRVRALKEIIWRRFV